MHTCEYDPKTGFITWDQDNQRQRVGKSAIEWARFCCWAASNGVKVRTKEEK